MELKFHEGLLFTSIEIKFRGKVKFIDNIVVDIGAAETIISPDVVEDIGIVAELEDNINSYYGIGGSIHNFFTKKIEEISFESVKLQQIKLDFGMIDPKGKINGLLGLDLLIQMNAMIDLKRLSMNVYEN